MPSQKDNLADLQNTLSDLSAKVDKLAHDLGAAPETVPEYVKDLQSRLDGFDSRLDVMEVAAPAALRALSAKTVRDTVKTNPYTTFEILESWGAPGGSFQFTKGNELRADHFPSLNAFVENGLLLGVPSDQRAQIEKLRAQGVEARTTH